jgi:DMSO/TMAO reductase YedYZ heme-binding membrane subunit
MKKKLKKSTWMPLALLVYTTAMAAYFLPKNTEISDTEKWVTFGASYLIVALLWYVLRLKEKQMEQYNRKMEDSYKEK